MSDRVDAGGGLVAGIILAAGRGSRMGGTKQLLPLHGLPLLAHSVRAAEDSALADIVVVLGHDAQAIAAAVPRRRARLVLNPAYAEGQSSSLRAGLRALGPDVGAAVILLGDQPFVRSEVIDALAGAYLDAWGRRIDGERNAGSAAAESGASPRVIIPTYGGRDGHPILLQRSLWPEVMAVRGDEGARSVIRAHPLETRRLAIDGGPPPRDVDTPEDYTGLSDA
jgi:molybdenum cofactor cytidylyltransferase